jgi:hypothetical protein
MTCNNETRVCIHGRSEHVECPECEAEDMEDLRRMDAYPNCTSLKADYITLSARFDRVLAERDKWREEYDNLAKFATQYERERDEARDALQRLVAHIVVIVGRAEKRGDVYTAKELRAALHKVWPPYYTEGE